MAALLALLTVVAGVVVGVWLFSADHLVLGVIALLAGIPAGVAVWMLVGDRRALNKISRSS